MTETETLIKAVYDRIEAMPSGMTEEQVRKIVTDSIANLENDPEQARKFRFGKPAPGLIGSKFARWGHSVQDVEFLYDLMSARAQSGMGKGPSQELTKAFDAISEAVYLSADEVRRTDRAEIDDMYPRIPKAEFRGSDAALIARGGERAWQDTNLYRAMIRAMDTAESGYGSQLIGAQYVGTMWEASRNKARISPLINTFEMTAPTVYLPVEVDFPEMLFVGESVASNSAEYGTSKTGSQRVSVAAKKFVIYQMWSGEMEEDSIMPFVPFLRAQNEKSLAFYSDSLVLNGDTETAGTGNVNNHDAAPTATKHYLAFDGIRRSCLVDNTNNAINYGAAVTLDALLGMRTYSIDATYKHDWSHPDAANDWIYACDPWTGDAIDKLDDFVSVDKFAQNAVVLTGQVGRVGQNPLIRTPALERTETDGCVNAAGSTTCGQVVAFNRNGCVIGWRRRVQTETERLPARDQTRIVHSLRMGFGRYTPTGAASGIEWAAVLYDITGI
jgi:HK97 family phage major capsid protein